MNREKIYRWQKRHPEKHQANVDRHNAKKRVDPELRRRRRDYEARRMYGLTPGELSRLADEQGGACAICGHVPQKEDRAHPRFRRGFASALLHIDHDHVTGKVRALLCGKCNILIGLADEDCDRLTAAIEYLRGHKA